MKGNSRKNAQGAKVQKTLKVLEVGDKVRVALEKLRKTGANKRPFPSQRWSSRVHVIAKVHARKVGFARYSVQALPRQRWEREDLQLVGKRKDLASGKVAQPEDSNDTADAESRQGAKQALRLVPVA